MPMEEKHIAKILSIEPDTHDVKRFRVEKPKGYTFIFILTDYENKNEAVWQKK